MFKSCAGLVALSSLLLSGAALAQEKIKVGVTATLEGTYTVLGEDGIRGHQTAINALGKKIGDKELEFIIASTDATPDSAIRAVRKLIEQDKVQILLAPLSGDEGIAVKNYAKTKPDITFVNGSSGAQAATLGDPAPNFYRFNTEGAQWMVGLGEHALGKGYKKVFLISEDYGFPYSQVQGFMASYCAKGGKVVDKAWVPLGTKDYAAVVAKIPKDVDAVLVVLGGSDAVNFLNQYEQAGGNKPMIGGSITVDQTVLNYKGKRRESLLGTASAGPMADSIDTPEWKKFVADYKATFKDGFPSPSLFAYLYYINTKATLDALDAVKGDLSGGQKKYREALQKTSFNGPAGLVKIDDNRNGVGTTYITEVAKAADGSFYNKVVRTVPNVTQTLGLSKAEFDKMGLGSRDVPDCRK
jgi:branched-chain amino acid transport system substrate-binding protein